MSDANKATVRTFLAALGRGDATTLKTIVTDDVVVITAGSSNVSGPRDYNVIMGVADAFTKITKSGIEFRILHLTAEGDRVACEAQGFSTMINGKSYNNEYHFLFSFRDGKVCQVKEYLDTKLADEVLGPYIGA